MDKNGLFKTPPFKSIDITDTILVKPNYPTVKPREIIEGPGILDGLPYDGTIVYNKSSQEYQDQYIEEAPNLSKDDLKEMLPKGWEFSESPDKKHTHVTDPETAKYIKDFIKNNADLAYSKELKKYNPKGYRIRIDAPDDKTNYTHIHKYNSKGQSINKAGEVISHPMHIFRTVNSFRVRKDKDIENE